MLRFKLSEKVMPLKNQLRDLLIYSNIQNTTIEVSDTQTIQNSIYVNLSQCQTYEDIMVSVAKQIYNPLIHNKCLHSSEILFLDKHKENEANQIASVLEHAIDPFVFSKYGNQYV